MFKFFALFIILSPFLTLNAATLSVTPENHEKNKEQTASIRATSSRSTLEFFNQCYRNVPAVIPNTSTTPANQLPVNISAFNLFGLTDKLVYRDDVELTHDDKFLSSNKLTYFVKDKRAIAEGDVKFVNGNVTLHAKRIATEMQTNQTSFYQSNYQFHGRNGRGDAARIFDNGQDLYELNDSTYSACPPEDNTWSLSATTLYIDNKEEVGSAYNAVLRIKDVPVFYFPYITYPTSDKRKTGLLFPSFDLSTNNGFTISQPLYINIAPNMDATITAKSMQKRGTLLSAEYRYLFDIGGGKFQAEYLANDKITDDKRYLYHWDHNVSFAKNWNFNATYSSVSDDSYFSDIDTPYGERSDNQLLQTANLSYRTKNWNSELEVRNFQILGNGDSPHKVLPKLSFNLYQPLNWKSLQLDLYSEISRFTHDDENVYTGTRVHIEPKLSLPLYYDSIFINTELKYMLSLYEQDIPTLSQKYSWYRDLESQVLRAIPSFKINSGVNFERDFTFLNSDYRQTLVPQIQYLYVPYQDQSAIGLYDTTLMQQDYYGLFRDNKFSGYDRISDANQLTLGVSSSFLNAQGQEKMRFAIGQNYYITESDVTLPDKTRVSTSSSSIIGEFDVNFAGKYFLHSGLEWDSENNIIKRANSTFEKRWFYNTYAQLNYRYIAPTDNEDLQVNQLGTKINWSINAQWTTFASYYYDLEYDTSFESIVGLKYQSCCWAIGLSYEEHMSPYYGPLSSINDNYTTEQNFSLTFELMGLGGVGYSDGDESLFDYGRPFYLQ
ncbi:organic solvent tolerance protein [Psychromonas sp. CNPT3]|uniref:LPS assembly protein LptD n=1 Tax=Psychromonas sp. CNPT3 TaxID=314282 RepID=UPI0002C0D979|nr:LPS assembly protein LptD [Psychromonas sp. CNPT3]AGH80717.1 organic solvent tolerance protein [Psychromonas sp. CNPT3]